MMAAGIAMVVTGAGAASLLWPAGSGVAMICAPICALLSAHLVTPGVEALRRPGTAPDA
jgi:hypothetical protein